MPAAWIIYHEGGQVRTMHAYSVEQARDFAKLNTATNKWAWAHVAQELERHDSPNYSQRSQANAEERKAG